MRRIHMAVRFGLALLIGLAASPGGASGQSAGGAVVGVVVDASTLRPLAGTQVVLVGSGRGVLTDQRGVFRIPDVPPGTAEIEVQRVGYSTQRAEVTVEAGATAELEFALETAALALDAVVVTGTAGGARAREVGTAISRIDERRLEAAPVVDLQGVLQGQAAGLNIVGNSGQPGAGATIRLRGNNSITQGNEPLIYIDGVRIFSSSAPTETSGSMQSFNPLADIRPQDIERVEVVRGPAATTLYGTEASGGVIQIFTRQGSEGRATWSAEVGLGMNNMGHIGPSSDPTGLNFNDCRGGVDGLGNPYTDVTCPSSGSWLKNGLVQRFTLGVTGGIQGFTYALSANYRDEEGVIDTGWAKDGGFRANFSARLRENLMAQFSSSFTTGTTSWVPEGNRSNSFILNVARGPYGQAKIGADPAHGLILDSESYDRKRHIISGLTLRHNVGDSFDHRLTVGYDYNSVVASFFAPIGFFRFPTGQYDERNWDHTTTSVDYVATYRTGRGRLTSATSAGFQAFRDTDRSVDFAIQNFAAPGVLPTLTLGPQRDIQGDTRLTVINAGFFGQQVIGLDDRLFLTVGLRVDGNSAFGDDFGLQAYPKLSASYILSDHDFWPTSFIQEFKLRGAVGDAGKAPGAFDAVLSWAPVSADGGLPAFTPAQVGNPDLGPERTREIELGFDASALDGRLALEFTGFEARTMDALIPVQPIPSQGFSSPQLRNLGELRNRGFEAVVDLGLVRTADMDLGVRLQASRTLSKAIDLGGQDIVLNATHLQWVREGYPVPAFFGTKILNPDEFAEPVLEEDAYLGSVYPDRNFGIGGSLRWKNVTLDALGEYQGGAYNLNNTGWLNSRRDMWSPCFAARAAQRAAAAGDPSALDGIRARERAMCHIDVTKQLNSFWVDATDFFRLRHVTATVTLPDGWVPGASNASLSVSGRNLLTVTSYSGLDPEVSDVGSSSFFRNEYYNMPQYRTFIATLRVRF